MAFLAAAKGRRVFSFAAACLAASLLLVPSAEASRDLPISLGPALELPVAIPEPTTDGASFELLAPADRILFAALSSLQESELAQVLDRRRFRPLSATVSRDLASGVSTRLAPSISLGSGDLGWKLHQGDYFLEPDPLGPVDSPNLYQAFGFDGLNVTDPFGECWWAGDDVPCSVYYAELKSQFSSKEELIASGRRSARFLKGEVVGAAKLVPETASAAWNVVSHPIQSYEAANEAVAGMYLGAESLVVTAAGDPSAVVGMATGAAQNTLFALSSVDEDVAAEATGKILAGAAIGGAATKVVGRVSRLARTGRRAAKAADAAEDLVPGRGVPREPLLLAQPGKDLFVGTYSRVRAANLRSGLNPTHTPHHSVQAAVSDAGSRSAGISINLRKNLHQLTRTYRRPVQPAPNLRTHLARDVRDLRRILREVGHDPRRINMQLQELIRRNKAIGGLER